MRRLFALLLAMSMILSAAPFGAFAAEEETVPATEAIAEVETPEALASVAIEEVTAETEAPVMLADGDISSGTPDGEPPVLTGMTLSVTTVTAPGEIEVTVSATDDVSGLNHGLVEFICQETDKILYAELSSTYWDEEIWERVPYPDGNLHGTIEIDQYVESGSFEVMAIQVYDIAENGCYYHYKNSSNPIPDCIANVTFNVVDTEIPDGAPPVITGMPLSTTDIIAPGEIEVVVSATDDVSGVNHGLVEFICQETDKTLYAELSSTYWDDKTGERVPYPDGNLHGTIEIDQYVESGSFEVMAIQVYDVAGNGCYYHYKNTSNPIPDCLADVTFHVTESDTPDGDAPVLTGMSLTATTMTAPGTIEVTVSATEDVSGMNHGLVEFVCQETGKTLYAELSSTYWDEEIWERVPYPDGNLHGIIEIDQYVESGCFEVMAIQVYDVAGNGCYYHYKNTSNPIPDCVAGVTFNVLNAIPDVTTSVAKPEFVDQVQDAADDAYIVADFSGETTMPEEVFDAIAGTDKTLDLVSEGVTWRFNGEDITEEIKPIDLNVQITKVEENTSDAGQEIQNKLDETPGVVMKFAENGELPGKATIQVKVDYAMREYLGTDQKLCVYYYNSQTGQLELVAENLTVLNDTYVEFTITHCSYYILTTKLDTNAEPKPDPEPEVNDVYWKLENGTLTIYGKGKMDDYERIDVTVDMDGWMETKIYGNTPWYTRADEITAIVIEEGITHVGEFSFFGFDKVTSVKLPSTLKTIGGHSFQDNKALTAIDLPNKLEYVGPYAFSGCMGIDELKLPSSLLKLGGWSFSCGIKKLYIDSMEYWMNVEFGPGESWGHSTANPMHSGECELYVDGVLTTDIVIPDGTTEIPMYRFYQLKSLTSITIPDSVTYIGEGAFWGCEGLTEIVIPDSVTYLGTQLLFECPNLESAKLPAGLTEIPYRTFGGATKLKNFTMPENVTSIGSTAFEGCENLTHFSSDNSLEKVNYLGDYAFNGCKKLELGDVKLADELYYLGCYALARCDGMTSVTIPGSISNVTWDACSNSVNLEHVTIEEGVTTIESAAFAGCSSLTSVIIPKSVGEIGNWAFHNTGLTAVYILNDSCNITAITGEHDNTVGTLGKPGVTTIYGLADSTAETHATQYGYAFDLVPQTCEFGFHDTELKVAQSVTCTEHGMQEEICKQCGETVSETLILCSGHDLVDGVCTVCGESFVAYGSEGDWSWALSTDGTLTLYTTVDWLPSVVGVYWESFADQITKIVFADGIAGCDLAWGGGDVPTAMTYPNLTTIELGRDVLMNFMHTIRAPKLTKFVIDPENEYYAVDGGVLIRNFDPSRPEVHYYPANLTATTYRTGPITYIAEYAMLHADEVEKLYIDATMILPAAIRAMKNLTDIYMLFDGWYPVEGEISDADKLGDPAKLTIHGYPGTQTEEMATGLGYKFVPLTVCDISGHVWVRGTAQDGKVTDACSRCDATQTHTLLPDGMNVAVSDTAETTLKKELTAAEAARVEAGESYQFYLDSFDISGEVSANERELLDDVLEQELEGYKVGSYMDISLYKQIGDDKPAALTELDEPIPVVVNVPKQLQNTSKYIERTYDVVRIHEGESTVLGGTYDAENQTFTFETDAFSTYILVYHDLRLGGMLGDVNDDDTVNVLDLMYLANYFAKGEIINQANADVNGDGLLDVRDLMFLANVFAGKETLE